MTDTLLTHLAPYLKAPTWHIAFSGGLDSTVLLHQLADLRRRHALPPLSAIHVHHGLQSAADAWPAHCQQLCDRLSIPLRVVHVHVAPGASIEQAAREARYQAFSAVLQSGEILLTAQHRDDQAETLLFRLLRGAGVRGLAAMRRARPLAAGWLVRPLLDVPRDSLRAYALAHQVQWIEDPSNADDGLSRNFLRLNIFPRLAPRWPQASQNIARAAAHLGEALQLLEGLGQEDLQEASRDHDYQWLGVPSLALAPLRHLSPLRQRNALQTWLAPLTRLPDAAHWAGWASLRDAGPDATPCWQLADGELHASQQRVWWLSGAWLQRPFAAPPWLRPAEALALPGNGMLHWHGAAWVGECEIRYRQGGEILDLPGRGRRDLKRLLNEARVPGFARARWPLLYVDGQLRGVANLDRLNQESRLLQWTPPAGEQRLR